jgi:glycoside hydrolase-like protein
VIGFDYTDRIPPAALKAAGCAVAFRYVMPQTPYWVKALRNAEAQELLAAGIPIVSNFESSANREDGGAQAGHDDAVTLLADWHALGAPSGLIGWFSADWDVQPSEIPAVLAYLNAAASVLGGKQYVGCYGGLRAVSAAIDAGFGGWQTVAWSGGQWDSRAVARQTGRQLIVGGVQVDENLIINLAALGAWGGPTSGGTDMANNVIPPSIAHHFPGLDLSADFPANAQFDEATADIWGDARAEAAWRYGLANSQKLDQLLARPTTPTVDLAALEAAIVAQLLPHLNGNVDVNALATVLAPAIVAHLGLQVVAK